MLSITESLKSNLFNSNLMPETVLDAKNIAKCYWKKAAARAQVLCKLTLKLKKDSSKKVKLITTFGMNVNFIQKNINFTVKFGYCKKKLNSRKLRIRNGTGIDKAVHFQINVMNNQQRVLVVHGYHLKVNCFTDTCAKGFNYLPDSS